MIGLVYTSPFWQCDGWSAGIGGRFGLMGPQLDSVYARLCGMICSI